MKPRTGRLSRSSGNTRDLKWATTPSDEARNLRAAAPFKLRGPGPEALWFQWPPSTLGSAIGTHPFQGSICCFGGLHILPKIHSPQ